MVTDVTIPVYEALKFVYKCVLFQFTFVNNYNFTFVNLK